MRQTDTADDRAGAGHLHGGVVRQGGTHAFEHGVRTVTVGHFQYLGHGFVAAFLNEISGAELAGDSLTIGMAAHGDDAGGSHQLGGKYRAQADRTIAEHNRGVARLDFGRGCRMVTGRHHVG